MRNSSGGKIMLLLMLIVWALPLCGATAEPADSVKIHFRQSRVEYLPGLKGNGEAVSDFVERVKRLSSSGVEAFKGVEVVGSASPEGSVSFNRWLSEHRAASLFEQLGRLGIDREQITFRCLGRNWRGLLERVAADNDVPLRDEAIVLIEDIIEQVEGRETMTGDPLQRLKSLGGGAPYRYMYRRIFPDLRSSWLVIEWDESRGDFDRVALGLPVIGESVVKVPRATDVADVTSAEVYGCRRWYLGIRTNMLFDALVIPNLGFDIYLGRNWSLNGQWMYSWFKSDRHHRYWRVYGGDLEVRYWFGKAAHSKPLGGHHAGVYGGIATYDFEFGGRGYLGDRWSYFAGVSYGYSLAVAKRFNIDFVVGVGYLGGEYKEYVPEDDCYVWQSTKQRHWFGPTKAEVSLVWLIGCDNFNRKKGGRR